MCLERKFILPLLLRDRPACNLERGDFPPRPLLPFFPYERTKLSPLRCRRKSCEISSQWRNLPRGHPPEWRWFWWSGGGSLLSLASVCVRSKQIPPHISDDWNAGAVLLVTHYRNTESSRSFFFLPAGKSPIPCFRRRFPSALEAIVTSRG